jgi:hypothetical protein
MFRHTAQLLYSHRFNSEGIEGALKQHMVCAKCAMRVPQPETIDSVSSEDSCEAESEES